ncbi:MAG: glutamate mutase L, partial [Tenericutes bacterium]|nr:glutamate mutase L [Mycoplasmatota bacterium]
RLPNRVNIIKEALAKKNISILKPSEETEILIDEDYIMASLGVLSKKHPEAALKLLKKSLGIG